MKHNNRKTNKYDINKANINISINTVFKIFAVFCHYCDGCQVTWHHSPIALLKIALSKVGDITRWKTFIHSENCHYYGDQVPYKYEYPRAWNKVYIWHGNTSGIYSDICQIASQSLCRSPAHNTWCHIRLSPVMPCCTGDLLYQVTLKKINEIVAWVFIFLNVNLPKVT